MFLFFLSFFLIINLKKIFIDVGIKILSDNLSDNLFDGNFQI